MAKRLSPAFLTLIYDATLKSFWRRQALRRFLRQAGVAESFLATWAQEDSKRDFLDRVFAKLPDHPRGQDLLLQMARDLSAQDSFPDLTGWEDSKQKIRDATVAVAAIRRALHELDDQARSRTDQEAARERHKQAQHEALRSRETLDTLNSRLTALAGRLGSQEAGYEFQTWFYDLMDHFEIMNRRPFITGGRQIDGSVTVSGTTYLVELKFTQQQSGATDIDSALKKINDKADNTMGIMISISGYSEVAIKEASGRRTPLLLMDHRHLFFALGGGATFTEIIDRVRRHASQTGEAFLPPEGFGG
jgi:hypothetical protein